MRTSKNIIQLPKIPFTAEGLEKLKEERKTLLAERPDAVENLRKAREMGDLRENGYYKAARQRLSFLDARIRRLDRLIRFAVVKEHVKTDTVEIGSTVVITGETGTSTYTIVGGYESDPANQTVSYRSPIGSALMGKRAGDTITVNAPKGMITYTVKEIRS